MRDDNRRYEAARGAEEVDDAVQASGIVRRQVLWVLQVCHRRSAIETQRKRNDGDTDVRIAADEAKQN